MPLFYQQYINQHTKLAIWKIEESEAFFAQTVPLQREISHPHKRLQHLAGRYLLRYLFPAFPYESILIASTQKPYLHNEAYHFSISHCGDYAAAIVSTTERVGIDIEVTSNKILKIAHKFATNKERLSIENYLKNYPTELKNQHLEMWLTMLWCCKETMFKWYNIGNVDFKKMLLVSFNKAENEGHFNTLIVTQKSVENLLVYYKVFKELNLTFAHH